jgi:hypothetical protein
MQQTELRQKYKSKHTNTLKLDGLTYIADALEAHSDGMKQILGILRQKVALVKKGLDKKQIEAPRGSQMCSQSSYTAPPPQATHSNRLKREPRFNEAIKTLGNLNNV